jgi:hypothetical protein
MGLQGDLSTLDLTSLFQNLEGAQKTGLLTVLDRDEPTELFFESGKLALITWPGRIGLLEYLAESGTVAPEAIERARKERKRRQSVGAALVAAEELTEEDFRGIASARLVDDACELLAAGAKRFEFAECKEPSRSFDGEERELELSMPATTLLLESARRSDHWAQIREHLPSDSTHYLVAKAPRPTGDPARDAFVAELLELLDGTRTVREIVGRFPARRFDAYQALSDLAAKHSLRPITASDLEKRVLEISRRDKRRALSLLERGLEENPRHLGLLCAKALLAERAGELEQASEALKLVVQLQLENAAREDARATLAKLRKIDEKDPFVWERSFELAIEDRRLKDAFAHGERLIELYEAPGLHRKVAAVHERLIEAFGKTWDLVRDLARARAAAGDRDAALKSLESYAATMIAAEAYPQAIRAHEEALSISPGRKKTKEALEEIKSGELLRRRKRWRRRRLLALAAFLGLVVAPWIGWELLARRAYVAATREAIQDGGDLVRLRGRLEALRGRYVGTATARFDVAPLIEEIEARQREQAAAGPNGP